MLSCHRSQLTVFFLLSPVNVYLIFFIPTIFRVVSKRKGSLGNAVYSNLPTNKTLFFAIVCLLHFCDVLIEAFGKIA